MTINPHHTQQNGKLFAALAKAQAEAKYVKKDQVSNFDANKPYAKSEDIINDCKECLNNHGLALLPLSFAASPCDVIAAPTENDGKVGWLKRPIMISRFFKLCHESGEFEIVGPYDWPTNPNNMNTNFTAFGGTDTFSLAYVYRDILGMPRLTPQEIKQFELEEQKLKQAINNAKAENGETVPPEKPKPKPTPEAKPGSASTSAAPKATPETPKATPEQKQATEAPKATQVATNPAKAPEAVKAAAPGPNVGAQPAAASPAPSVASPTSSTAPTSPGETKPIPPQQGAASAPSAGPSPTTTASQTTTPTAGAAATSGADDKVMRDRQMAILARLQRYATKRTKELSGDVTAVQKELNDMGKCPTDKPVMLDGKFKLSGLTNESISTFDEALRMVSM